MQPRLQTLFFLVLSCLSLSFVFLPLANASTIITNGDFSDSADLAGFTATGAVIKLITEGAPGHVSESMELATPVFVPMAHAMTDDRRPVEARVGRQRGVVSSTRTQM